MTPEEKIRFFSLKFFGTTDNREDDVNPFDDLNEFLDNSIGSLTWGTSGVVVRRSKTRFAFNFFQVLKIYRIILEPSDIMSVIDDNSKSNREAVDEFIELATF
jgi:hypothetical protein